MSADTFFNEQILYFFEYVYKNVPETCETFSVVEKLGHKNYGQKKQHMYLTFLKYLFNVTYNNNPLNLPY